MFLSHKLLRMLILLFVLLPAMAPLFVQERTLLPVAPAPPGMGAQTHELDTSLYYFYADTYQIATATGVSASLSQPRPFLDTANDYHTLAEIAAISGDGKQVLEIGWTIDSLLNGDTNPHLFTETWVNGLPGCYNGRSGCDGYVQVSKTKHPGMKVSVTNTPQQYGVKFLSGKWWVLYQGVKMGYYPESHWKGLFTSLGLAHFYGEVAAGEATPCTDMGNDVYGDTGGSAVFTSISYVNGPSVSIHVGAVTTASYYDVGHLTANGFSYGGPGAC